MEPWQERLLTERDELSRKIVLLDEFTKTDKYFALPSLEKIDLLTQSIYMKKYLEILNRRIRRFS